MVYPGSRSRFATTSMEEHAQVGRRTDRDFAVALPVRHAGPLAVGTRLACDRGRRSLDVSPHRHRDRYGNSHHRDRGLSTRPSVGRTRQSRCESRFMGARHHAIAGTSYLSGSPTGRLGIRSDGGSPSLGSPCSEPGSKVWRLTPWTRGPTCRRGPHRGGFAFSPHGSRCSRTTACILQQMVFNPCRDSRRAADHGYRNRCRRKLQSSSTIVALFNESAVVHPMLVSMRAGLWWHCNWASVSIELTYCSL